MNMLPPAIATFSAILKKQGHEVQVFDTTYYAIDFSEPETGKPTIDSYLEGAFGELNGSFINYPFFDALH